jgi:DNA processing protein
MTETEDRTAPTIEEFYTVEPPTQEQWEDPSMMDLRQLSVIMSTLIEPGDQQVPTPGDYAAVVSAMVAGTYTDAHGRMAPRFDRRNIERVFRRILEVGSLVLIPGDTAYPSGLYRLPARPIVLYVRGDVWSLTAPERLAIVGARAATSYGEHVATELASALAERGTVIVSGGAYGIDGTAHRSAIASGGKTVAILAGGVDRMYPVGHEALLNRVIESGAVISEVPPGSAPTRWRFLQRNRIIAAMSEAVIVVEAGVRSGSLNTAGHAHALGMPLGAVPGPITSPASAGCHRLLREFDAVAITSADDARALVVR